MSRSKFDTFFLKPFTVGFFLEEEKKAGRVSRACLPLPALIPLWPRLHTVRHVCAGLVCAAASPHFVRRLWPCLQALSAMCPPRVSHVSALCPLSPLSPRLQTLPAICLPYLRLVSAMCPPCVRSLAQVHHAPSPLDFVRSWPAVGQGRGIMKYKILSPQCATRILHACLSVSHLGSQIRPLQARHMLEKLFGVYAGIIFWVMFRWCLGRVLAHVFFLQVLVVF